MGLKYSARQKVNHLPASICGSSAMGQVGETADSLVGWRQEDKDKEDGGGQGQERDTEEKEQENADDGDGEDNENDEDDDKEKDDGEDTIVIETAHDAEAMSWKF